MAVEARDIVRTFHIGENRIEVLKGVSLTVNHGETLFLVGPSGAGKTSLLYTLAGLEKPNEGDVVINGQSLYKLGRREQAKVRNTSMGYVFQSFFLLPELTAVENVMVPAMIRGNYAKARAMELLERVEGPSDPGDHAVASTAGEAAREQLEDTGPVSRAVGERRLQHRQLVPVGQQRGGGHAASVGRAACRSPLVEVPPVSVG